MAMGGNKFCCLVVTGLILIVCGFIGYFIIRAKVREAFIENMVIDSKSHKNFAKWARQDDPNDTPVYQNYYLWNITNPVDVLNGVAKPNYHEIGPYVYRKYEHIEDQELDAEFSDNGKQLRYNRTEYYYYQPDLSCNVDQRNGERCNKDPDVVNIVNLNVYYQILGGHSAASVLATVGFLGGIAADTAKANAWGNSNADSNYYGAFNGFITMTAAQSTAIVKGLANPSRLGAFMKHAGALPSASDKTSIDELFDWNGWGTESNYQNLLRYLGTQATRITDDLAASHGVENSLFLQKRSPTQILLGPDPMMAALGAPSGLLSNGSVSNYVIRTGKDNIDEMGMNYYVEYKGKTRTNVWGPGLDVEIKGRTSALTPFLGIPPDDYSIYADFVKRYVKLIYGRSEKVKGIPTTKYTPEETGWTEPKAQYGNTIPGMLNMEPIMGNGIQYHVSPRHWQHVPTRYRELITGDLDPNPNYPTELFVEPVTGFPISAIRRIQYNYFVNFSTVSVTNVNITDDKLFSVTDMFYPVFGVEDTGIIGDKSAEDLKKAVVGTATLRKLILGLLVGVGIAMILAGATLMVQLNTQNQQADAAANAAGDENGPSGESETNPLNKSASGVDSNSHSHHDSTTKEAPTIVQKFDEEDAVETGAAAEEEMTPVGAQAS